MVCGSEKNDALARQCAALAKAVAVVFCITVSFASAATAMRFELVGNGGNCNGCEWVSAQGAITPQSVENFRDFVAKNGRGHHVVLHSPGGSLAAGLELGRLFRQHEVATSVGETVGSSEFIKTIRPGTCASACAYAFLGGVSRSLEISLILRAEGASGESRLGVHQFFRRAALESAGRQIFTSQDLTDEQKTAATIAVYLAAMGVDASLLGLAANAGPDEMYWVSRAEADTLRVTFTPTDFQPWAIEAHQNGVVAYTRTKDAKTTVSVFCTRRAGITVMISDQFGSNGAAARLRDCASGPTHEILGVRIPTEAIVDGPLVRGSRSLSFRLPRAPDGTDGAFRLDVPRACHLNYSVPTGNMRQNVSVALRNCL